MGGYAVYAVPEAEHLSRLCTSPAQSFWAPGSPSGAGDCIAMSLPSGMWTDMPCGTVLPFLCEEKLYGGATLAAQVTPVLGWQPLRSCE